MTLKSPMAGNENAGKKSWSVSTNLLKVISNKIVSFLFSEKLMINFDYLKV